MSEEKEEKGENGEKDGNFVYNPIYEYTAGVSRFEIDESKRKVKKLLSRKVMKQREYKIRSLKQWRDKVNQLTRRIFVLDSFIGGFISWDVRKSVSESLEIKERIKGRIYDCLEKVNSLQSEQNSNSELSGKLKKLSKLLIKNIKNEQMVNQGLEKQVMELKKEMDRKKSAIEELIINNSHLGSKKLHELYIRRMKEIEDGIPDEEVDWSVYNTTKVNHEELKEKSIFTAREQIMDTSKQLNELKNIITYYEKIENKKDKLEKENSSEKQEEKQTNPNEKSTVGEKENNEQENTPVNLEKLSPRIFEKELERNNEIWVARQRGYKLIDRIVEGNINGLNSDRESVKSISRLLRQDEKEREMTLEEERKEFERRRNLESIPERERFLKLMAKNKNLEKQYVLLEKEIKKETSENKKLQKENNSLQKQLRFMSNVLSNAQQGKEKMMIKRKEKRINFLEKKLKKKEKEIFELENSVKKQEKNLKKKKNVLDNHLTKEDQKILKLIKEGEGKMNPNFQDTTETLKHAVEKRNAIIEKLILEKEKIVKEKNEAIKYLSRQKSFLHRQIKQNENKKKDFGGNNNKKKKQERILSIIERLEEVEEKLKNSNGENREEELRRIQEELKTVLNEHKSIEEEEKKNKISDSYHDDDYEKNPMEDNENDENSDYNESDEDVQDDEDKKEKRKKGKRKGKNTGKKNDSEIPIDSNNEDSSNEKSGKGAIIRIDLKKKDKKDEPDIDDIYMGMRSSNDGKKIKGEKEKKGKREQRSQGKSQLRIDGRGQFEYPQKKGSSRKSNKKKSPNEGNNKKKSMYRHDYSENQSGKTEYSEIDFLKKRILELNEIVEKKIENEQNENGGKGLKKTGKNGKKERKNKYKKSPYKNKTRKVHFVEGEYQEGDERVEEEEGDDIIEVYSNNNEEKERKKEVKLHGNKKYYRKNGSNNKENTNNEDFKSDNDEMEKDEKKMMDDESVDKIVNKYIRIKGMENHNIENDENTKNIHTNGEKMENKYMFNGEMENEENYETSSDENEEIETVDEFGIRTIAYKNKRTGKVSKRRSNKHKRTNKQRRSIEVNISDPMIKVGDLSDIFPEKEKKVREFDGNRKHYGASNSIPIEKGGSGLKYVRKSISNSDEPLFSVSKMGKDHKIQKRKTKDVNFRPTPPRERRSPQKSSHGERPNSHREYKMRNILVKADSVIGEDNLTWDKRGGQRVVNKKMEWSKREMKKSLFKLKDSEDNVLIVDMNMRGNQKEKPFIEGRGISGFSPSPPKRMKKKDKFFYRTKSLEKIVNTLKSSDGEKENLENVQLDLKVMGSNRGKILKKSFTKSLSASPSSTNFIRYERENINRSPIRAKGYGTKSNNVQFKTKRLMATTKNFLPSFSNEINNKIGIINPSTNENNFNVRPITVIVQDQKGNTKTSELLNQTSRERMIFMDLLNTKNKLEIEIKNMKIKEEMERRRMRDILKTILKEKKGKKNMVSRSVQTKRIKFSELQIEKVINLIDKTLRDPSDDFTKYFLKMHKSGVFSENKTIRDKSPQSFGRLEDYSKMGDSLPSLKRERNRMIRSPKARSRPGTTHGNKLDKVERLLKKYESLKTKKMQLTPKVSKLSHAITPDSNLQVNSTVNSPVWKVV